MGNAVRNVNNVRSGTQCDPKNGGAVTLCVGSGVQRGVGGVAPACVAQQQENGTRGRGKMAEPCVEP